MEKVYLKLDPYALDNNAPEVTPEEVKAFHNWVTPKSESDRGLTVAVVDSGIDETHPVFDGVEIEHQDLTGGDGSDGIGHGTSTAALIVQLAPNVSKIINVRIFGGEGRTSGEILMNAYDLLLERADEIDLANFSLGTSRKVDQIDARHNQLVAKGVRTVSASGNSGDDSGSPATAQNAFSVGALTPNGEMTDFSSFSPEYNTPSICALGKNIKLARATGTSMGRVLDEHWTMASGTSFACPIALAGIANALAGQDSFSRKNFVKTAGQITESPRDGGGVLDLEEAIEAGRAPADVKTTIWAHEYGDKNLIWAEDRLFETGRYEVTRNGDQLTTKEYR